jgi:predicted metal-dependent hydrolase
MAVFADADGASVPTRPWGKPITMHTADPAKALTTAGPEVVVRRMHFDLDERVPRYWHSGSPYITHFFNALSIVFPEGERFFIDSVRRFEKDVRDPRTRLDVRSFIRQEAHHGHQHELYNRILADNGVPVTRPEAFLRSALSFVRRHAPARMQLAATITLEHFTAILANQLLTNPRNTDGMHAAMRPLWVWHAIEETEHKAVCFDVYRDIGGSELQRVLMMARMMIGFPFFITCIQLFFVAKDRKLFDHRDLRRFLAFAWGPQGFVRAVWPEIKAYFRRDFHPWQADNRALIDVWAPEYQNHRLGA